MVDKSSFLQENIGGEQSINQNYERVIPLNKVCIKLNYKNALKIYSALCKKLGRNYDDTDVVKAIPIVQVAIQNIKPSLFEKIRGATKVVKTEKGYDAIVTRFQPDALYFYTYYDVKSTIKAINKNWKTDLTFDDVASFTYTRDE